MIFKSAWVLFILPVFVFLFFLMRRHRRPGFLFPSGEIINAFRPGSRAWLAGKAVYIRAACIVLVIIALARPQLSRETRVKKEGIAIMLAIDCSSTMLADDLELSWEDLGRREKGDASRYEKRIDAAREVARDFIKSRQDDLIGLVAFAAQAYVVCPTTFDHDWLTRSLDRVKVGLIKDGTAIGSGILSSVNSVKETKARTKIVILLTDGINNFGNVPPLVAAKAARALGIKIYTVGLVSKGPGLYLAGDGTGRRVYRDFKVDIDEDELRQISALTGGEYFKATDLETLRQSYREIDRLEKFGMEESRYEEYVDVFRYFLIPALALLVADIILRKTFLRKIP